MSWNQQTFGPLAWQMTEYTCSCLIKNCSITFTVCLQVCLSNNKQRHQINPSVNAMWSRRVSLHTETERALEVTRVSCWDPQAHIPLCQRSEVDGNISPLPGLKGHDFELLVKPNITHNQITTLQTLPSLPLHSVSPSPFRKRWLNKAEECGKGVGVWGVAGASQWRWLKTKNSTCGNRISRYVVLPLHGTRMPWARMHASNQATVYTDVGGGRALTDSGRALSRCPCLQSSR